MKTLLSLITILYNNKDCITFDDHTLVDYTFVDNTFVSVSEQHVNILLSDDSIDLCNSSNYSQNSRSNICYDGIEFIDYPFSPHHPTSRSSTNAEDYMICLQETKTNDVDKIELEGYTFKMKNSKKVGRKTGRIILCYKDHLENLIEPLETVK